MHKIKYSMTILIKMIDYWEWIDRIQDLITLIGVPIAVYLLWKIYVRK